MPQISFRKKIFDFLVYDFYVFMVLRSIDNDIVGLSFIPSWSYTHHRQLLKDKQVQALTILIKMSGTKWDITELCL